MPGYRPILKNFVSLASAEIVGKLIAFISTVYLARTLTVEGYGIIGFATAFVSYFILVVQFGLDTIGTRDISRDNALISKLVNNIIPLRILLTVFGYSILLILIFIISKAEIIRVVVILTGIQLTANIIQLNYVFQGLEKMHYPGIRQVINVLLVLIGYVLFVKSFDDITIAAMIISGSAVAANLGLLIVYLKNYFKIRIEFDFGYWKYLLKEALPVALSGIMIAVYYNLDMVMLGYYKPETDVGIYNAAYKIFLLGIVPFSLILNSFFPSLSKYNKSAGKEFRWIISRYAAAILFTGIVISAILYIFRNELPVLIFGDLYSASAVPLTVLALNAAVISVNMFFGNPLLAWGRQMYYLYIVSAGAVTNVILNFVFIPEYSYLGASFATLLSEAVVFVGVVFFFTKYLTEK